MRINNIKEQLLLCRERERERERLRINKDDISEELEGFSEEGASNTSSDDNQLTLRRFQFLALHLLSYIFADPNLRAHYVLNGGNWEGKGREGRGIFKMDFGRNSDNGIYLFNKLRA